MATILLTVISADRRVDLAVPGDVAVARLIPGIATYFSDGRAGDPMLWALGPVGRSPYPPDQSLAQAGVVNGAILELHEVGRAGPPPPGAAAAPPPFPATAPPPVEPVPWSNPIATSQAWSTPPPTPPPSPARGAVNWPPVPAGPRPAGSGGPSPWGTSVVSPDSPAGTQPADEVGSRGKAGPVRVRSSIPAVDPLARPIADPMSELDAAMADRAAATHGVRAAGGSASAIGTSVSTSLGFLALVIAAAVLAARYIITVKHQIPEGVLGSAAAALLALYYGGITYGLLEPLLGRLPGGDSLLALGGRGHTTAKHVLTDAEISERLQRLGVMVEDFIYDIALLLAGHNPPLDYVDHATAQKLRANVAPFLRSGQKLSPNFGQHGEMKVHWDPNNDVDPVRCEVTFEDLSTRETEQGDRIVSGRHRVLVTVELDPTISRVLDADLQPAPSQDHSKPPGE